MLWRKILCAVDFSESSRAALREAAFLARRFGAELTLLHVEETLPGGEAALLSCPPDVCKRTAFEVGHSLETWRLEAEDLVGRPVAVALTSGSPAREILRTAADGGFDLVVTGTRGRTGVARLVLGSAAEEVVRRAPCPVLVAREPGAPSAHPA